MQPAASLANDMKLQENVAETAAPSAVPEPLPRRFERFTLLNRVARGGMGEVYLATARGIEGAERPLIVKIIRPDHIDDRSFVARFLDEARIQAQLQHPGVAQILEASTDSAGKPYVVVEYVEGRNLSDMRARAGQLGVRVSWPEALALAVCLGEALTHIHERTDADGRPLEIVHRDLSPQNVMVGFGGEVKLIDFGTARGQNRRCQTIAGVVFAKPGYVAPEVANNTPGGAPADLYAFGVILWELLAGRRFLNGEAAAHLAAVGAGKRPLPPLARVIGAPLEIDAMLAQLTATRIEERFASARQATQELVKLLQRAPSLADGDRSVRGRISDLMRRLYPAEPSRSRADFVRRLAEARSQEPRAVVPPPSPEPPESSDPSLLPGTRYRLLRELGRGGMGVVHEACHLDLGRTVALKLLSGEAMSSQAESRFRSEARAIAQLSHENLVKVYDFGACSDGRLYYAMELLDGDTLAARLLREQRLSASTVIDFGIQLCRALEVAHRASVVHHDIKPANLFVTRAGTLKVLDFGIAKCLGEAPVAEEKLSEARREGMQLTGTPEYMAPEQARGESDARSDLYAVGAVLYELLTGNLPFEADAPLELIALKSDSEASVEFPEDEALPRRLTKAIQCALSVNPDHRFQSAAELRRELEAALHEPAPKRTLRRRVSTLALSLMVLGGSVWIGARAAQVPEVRAFATEAAHQVTVSVGGIISGVRERRAELLAQRAAGSGKVAAPGLPAAKAVAALAPSAPAEPVAAASDAVSSAQVEAEAEDTAEVAAASEAPVSETPGMDSPEAVKRADELASAGRSLKALEVLRGAAEREPRNVAILAALSKALTKNRSWGDAVRVARRRVELDASPAARMELARLERATGHRERAVAMLNAISDDPAVGSEARDLLRSLTGSEKLAARE